jgi:NADH-quinone oxidoreductase subunit H
MMDMADWTIMLAKLGLVVFVLLQVVPLMVWIERRGSALMQNRLGPNRVGPFGILQSLADVIKFIWKEDPIPGHVEKFYYVLAPLICVIPAFMTFAVLPFASSIEVAGKVIQFQISNLNVGLLYIFSIASLGVYGIIMAGWASNNKYALLGSLRSSSQMISYELSMTLSVIGIVMAFSSVHLGEIARAQGETLIRLGSIEIPKWGIFLQPFGFLIFLTAAFAETNRLPFDLPEGESEIVAGYHLEYGSMKFALFFMAEYLNMTASSALMATLFFGGWQLLPGMHWLIGTTGSLLHLSVIGVEWVRILFEITSFTIKVGAFMWLFVWVRWTLPRFRYDQLMDLGWKVMFPLALVNVFATGFLIFKGWF